MIIQRSLLPPEVEYLALVCASEEAPVTEVAVIVSQIEKQENSDELRLRAKAAVLAVRQKGLVSIGGYEKPEFTVPDLVKWFDTPNDFDGQQGPTMYLTDAGRRVFRRIGHPNVSVSRLRELRELLFGYPHGLSEEAIEYWASRPPIPGSLLSENSAQREQPFLSRAHAALTKIAKALSLRR